MDAPASDMALVVWSTIPPMFKKSPSANSMLFPPAEKTISSAEVILISPVVIVERVRMPEVAVTFEAPVPSIENASAARMSIPPADAVIC